MHWRRRCQAFAGPHDGPRPARRRVQPDGRFSRRARAAARRRGARPDAARGRSAGATRRIRVGQDGDPAGVDAAFTGEARGDRRQIVVDGRDVLALPRRELSDYRGRPVAMVFQEPGLALDPVYRVGDQIAEAVTRDAGGSWRAGRARALELFERVRIPSPAQRLDAYPHELSGGMRQRAMIALALACRPKLLLADEPTTALDATVQIQILLLLRELQRELGLVVIFVTHDIGVAIEVADHIAVMYAGRIVEIRDCRDVVRAPAHPYTQGLLAAGADRALGKGERLVAIPGTPPDLAKLPPGCAFAPRCGQARSMCEEAVPAEVWVGNAHRARCVLAIPISAG
jgi:peptide/nickel transport system ATP-binding protein